MNRVFIVTRGEYSDYRILTVFSTEEKADKYCKAVNKEGGWSTAEIEEYTLDEIEIEDGSHSWFVRMDKDGNTQECYLDDNSDNGYGFDINKNLHSHCFAKDEKHAIKITNERRAQLIANNKWPTK